MLNTLFWNIIQYFNNRPTDRGVNRVYNFFNHAEMEKNLTLQNNKCGFKNNVRAPLGVKDTTLYCNVHILCLLLDLITLKIY